MITKNIKIKKGNKRMVLRYEILKRPASYWSEELLGVRAKEAHRLIRANWGDIGLRFIVNNIFKSDLVLLLRDNTNQLVGLASICTKNVNSRKIYYFELTVVDIEYRSLNIAFRLNYLLMKKIIIVNALKCNFLFEFMLITPNMRVLGSLANIASTIYPNPYKYINKRISIADDETWLMANQLIKMSNKPDRKIMREGLVLEGSYEDTSWLIYEKDNVPQHVDGVVNAFGEHYLKYSHKTGREFIVRAKFTPLSIVKGFMK